MSKEESDRSGKPPDSGFEEEAVNHEAEATSSLPAIDGSAQAESNEEAENLTHSQAAPRTMRRRRLGARSNYSNGLIAYSA